ncbi:MAG: SurA N-terminal domain-containing protein [Proteobacteria bacterium]|nr:SurA N-terminal domain-containing protein [Pseudomonadota bacterium]MBU1711177.1 SurA N-terminal domain-containing protein [Pseudomonadota bacterium]
MLDLMRRKAQSPYLQATVVIIILVFIFWGVGTNQGNGPNIVASVNGDNISFEEYKRTYDRAYNQMREQFGGNIPASLLENLDIKNQVVEQLIQQALVHQGAQEMNILISKRELQDKILEMEAFKNQDRFDIKLYKEILAGSKMTEADFEASLRYDLLTTKVIATLSRFSSLAPGDVETRIAYDNEEIKFQYLKFNAEDFKKKVTVSDTDLAAYFGKNKDAYKTQPQLKIKYLSFLFEDDKDSIALSNEEISAYYNNNLDSYASPEMRDTRHILIKTAENASAEQVNAKRQQAEEVLAQLKTGKSFEALAKEYSEDSSASQGGKIGKIAWGQTVKPFEAAAFALKVGETSDVVKSRFGFHIIRVDAIEMPSVKKLEDVRGAIEATLKKDKAKNLTFKKANEAYEKLILSGSIDKYAQAEKTAIKETDFFSRQNPPKGPAGDMVIVNAAFQLKKGELSSLIEGTNGYFILFAEDSKESAVPALETVKKEVEKAYSSDRAKELAKEAAANVLAKLKDNGDIATLAKETAAKLNSSEFVSRTNLTSPDVPTPVINAALDLWEQQPLPEEIIAAGDSFYVVSFKEKKAADPQVIAEKEKEIADALKKENEARLFTAWLEFLRSRSEITINEQLL